MTRRRLSTTQGRHNANAFHHPGGVESLSFHSEKNRDHLSLRTPQVPLPTLAANILALVISGQPREDRPLTVSIIVKEHSLARLAPFRTAPGWKETKRLGSIFLGCEFVWDLTNRKLLQGSVPLVTLDKSSTLIVADPPAKLRANNTPSRSARAIQTSSDSSLHFYLHVLTLPPDLRTVHALCPRRQRQGLARSDRP